MLPSSSMPWKPAITATAPWSRQSRMRWVSMLWMRARVCEASVRMPICAPVNERALWPRLWIAIASSAIVFCSPVETSTSYSRGSGRSPPAWCASATSASVSPAIADTTTATRWPCSTAATTRRATRRIRSMSATLVPPYFWTISATLSLLVLARARAARGARPRPLADHGLRDRAGRPQLDVALLRRLGARAAPRDAHLDPIRRQRRGQAIRPLHRHHRSRREQVHEPRGLQLRLALDPIQVHVREPPRPRVLARDHEGRARHEPRIHAEPLGQPLHPFRLARAERPDQGHDHRRR